VAQQSERDPPPRVESLIAGMAVPAEWSDPSYRSGMECRAKLTSSSAIVETPRCRVGQFWPKVEDDILQTV